MKNTTSATAEQTDSPRSAWDEVIELLLAGYDAAPVDQPAPKPVRTAGRRKAT